MMSCHGRFDLFKVRYLKDRQSSHLVLPGFGFSTITSSASLSRYQTVERIAKFEKYVIVRAKFEELQL